MLSRRHAARGTVRMMDIGSLIARKQSRIIGFRRDLHRIPETAFTEKKTAAYVAERLAEMGLPCRTGIATTGIVAELSTGRPGPVLLLRADMDALPIEEETGLAFASEHPGVMHACGHDGHMAMLLGAAEVMSELRDELCGTVKFVFQPAEEGPGGAKPMIEAGIMDNPAVDYALGCHIWPDLPAGVIGVRTGPMMAAMDRFDVRIIGRGGHGAMPHQCIDALEVGCHVVGALQRLVSRNLNPLEPTVVTVGRFQAGSTFNVIAGEAEFCGTTRTFHRDIWREWPERIETLVAGICRAHGAEYHLEYTPGYPPLVNHEFMADIVRRCAGEAFGNERVTEPERTTGGEDMAFYLERVPGCFFCLGSGRPGQASIHNARFDFPEEILANGVEIHVRAALELLGTKQSTGAGG